MSKNTNLLTQYTKLLGTKKVKETDESIKEKYHLKGRIHKHKGYRIQRGLNNWWYIFNEDMTILKSTASPTMYIPPDRYIYGYRGNTTCSQQAEEVKSMIDYMLDNNQWMDFVVVRKSDIQPL